MEEDVAEKSQWVLDITQAWQDKFDAKISYRFLELDISNTPVLVFSPQLPVPNRHP